MYRASCVGIRSIWYVDVISSKDIITLLSVQICQHTASHIPFFSHSFVFDNEHGVNAQRMCDNQGERSSPQAWFLGLGLASKQIYHLTNSNSYTPVKQIENMAMPVRVKRE